MNHWPLWTNTSWLVKMCACVKFRMGLEGAFFKARCPLVGGVTINSSCSGGESLSSALRSSTVISVIEPTHTWAMETKERKIMREKECEKRGRERKCQRVNCHGMSWKKVSKYQWFVMSQFPCVPPGGYREYCICIKQMKDILLFIVGSILGISFSIKWYSKYRPKCFQCFYRKGFFKIMFIIIKRK